MPPLVNSYTQVGLLLNTGPRYSGALAPEALDDRNLGEVHEPHSYRVMCQKVCTSAD